MIIVSDHLNEAEKKKESMLARKMIKLEKDRDEEDERYLIRLMKIRKSLWT